MSMRLCLLISILCITSVMSQNVLLWYSEYSTYSDDYILALENMGITPIVVQGTELTDSDFIDIDLFMDATISFDSTCGSVWTAGSISAIQNYLNSGGSMYVQLELSGTANCGNFKLSQIVNPYLVSDTVTQVPGYSFSYQVVTSLPVNKQSLLTTPNSIAGNSVAEAAGGTFAGIDSDAGFIQSDAGFVGAVYIDSEVTVPGLKIMFYPDVNHDFGNTDRPEFENMITFLLPECDPTTECDGIACGTGLCGGACTNTCDTDTEVCSGNTCICDTSRECDNAECGTGLCGGACPNTCDTDTEVCSGNTCICDTSRECDNLECGTGFCGGSCPNTCDTDTEVCSGNTCICDTSRECDNAECGTGFCGGSCLNNCNSPFSCNPQVCVDTFDGNSKCINFGNPCPFVNACHKNECIEIDGFASCDLSIINCDDGNECTIDSCSPSSGCTYRDVTCDDGDKCTSEYCDPDFGCVIEDNEIECNDGNPCTIDYCDEMRGCQITWKDCDDNNPCTIDSCNNLTGDCINEEKICSDPLTHCSVDLFGECVQDS